MKLCLKIFLLLPVAVLGQTHIYQRSKMKKNIVVLFVLISSSVYSQSPIIPSTLDSLRLWIKADSLRNAANPYSADANIDSAYNWGSVGGAFTQATAGNRPLFKTGISATGLPGILFVASDYIMHNSSTSLYNFMHQSGKDWTAFVVFKASALSDGPIFSTADADFGVGAHLRVIEATDGWLTQIGDGTGSPALNRTSITGTDWVSNINFVVVTHDQTANPDYMLRVDGVKRDSANTSAGDYSSGNASNARLGRYLSGASQTYDGYIFELIVFEGRKSDATISGVLEYLYQKWAGIQYNGLVPTNLDTVQTTPNSISVKWDKVAGSDGYKLYRKYLPSHFQYPTDHLIATKTDADDTTFTDSFPPNLILPSGINYIYRVRSTFDDTVSNYSNLLIVNPLEKNYDLATHSVEDYLGLKWQGSAFHGSQMQLRRRIIVIH